MNAPSHPTTYGQTLSALGAAQKGAARGAPAYSRFVNRKIGRLFAALAIRWGLSPNTVTMISACFTFAGIALLAVFEPSLGLGIGVALLLVIGYALDSADGQVARFTKSGGPAGEWLDHVVDSVKIVTLPLAIGIQWFRFDVVDDAWLFVPLVSCVVASVSFFAMILTEQLRRAAGVRSVAPQGGRAPWLRSVLVLPTDYGVLCWSFLLLGWPTAFVWVYTVITALHTVHLILALVKWFRELSARGAARPDTAPTA